MTELDRTDPASRRLFQEVDLAPSEGDSSWEMLAAPVLTDRRPPGVFCTIAAEEPPPLGNAR